MNFLITIHLKYQRGNKFIQVSEIHLPLPANTKKVGSAVRRTPFFIEVDCKTDSNRQIFPEKKEKKKPVWDGFPTRVQKRFLAIIPIILKGWAKLNQKWQNYRCVDERTF